MTIQTSTVMMLHSRRPQHGAALLTGLIFLVVLTLLTLSAMKATSLEERMAGNARDQDLAFQAAEAAIRDAMINRVPTLSPSSPFAAGCAAGLCLNNTTTPVWTTITNNNDWNSAKTAAYSGALTLDGTTALPSQPRYIIELIQSNAASPGDTIAVGKGMPGSAVISYRVTARGWGLTSQANVTLQSTFNY